MEMMDFHSKLLVYWRVYHHYHPLALLLLSALPLWAAVDISKLDVTMFRHTAVGSMSTTIVILINALNPNTWSYPSLFIYFIWNSVLP